MIKDKIKTQKEIIRISRRLKQEGQKITTINGSFDLLHFGHIQALKEAKQQGDFLFVLLNSDQSVRLYKGINRPINPQKERALMLAVLECVDYVTIFNELNPKKLLNKIKPHVHCNSSEWGRGCTEREVVEKNGGKIYILKHIKGPSTTQLINKILAEYSNPSAKAVFLDRDGTINLNQPEYLYQKSNFKFAPNVIPALQKLSQINYKVIIITNQSGIGRNYFRQKDLVNLHQWMLKKLRQKKIRIDGIYYCPHYPNYGCDCRKPKIGLLMKAAKDFNLNLSKSWMIGDDEKDVLAGREANVQTIKIGHRLPGRAKIQPHYYVKNLRQAVDIISKNI